MYTIDELLENNKNSSRLKRFGKGKSQGWTGSFAQRSLAAKRLPQAVMKITSFSKSKGGAMVQMLYISRDGDIDLETDYGDDLKGAEEIKKYIEDWSDSFSNKHNSRKTMNMVLSLPRDTDKKVALEISRQFMKEQFKENHSYVMVGHDDTEQYHVHVVVKSQGHDGKQLNISKKDIQEWRSNYALKARELGVNVDASPRYARGLGTRQLKTSVHAMRERGAMPEVDIKHKNDVKKTIGIGYFKQIKNVKSVLDHNENERMEYAKAGLAAAGAALSANNDKQRAFLTQEAVKISKYAMELPVPKSRKQVDIERIIKQPIYSKQPDLKGIKPFINKTASKTTKSVMDMTTHELKTETAKEVLTFMDMVTKNLKGEIERSNQEKRRISKTTPDIER